MDIAELLATLKDPSRFRSYRPMDYSRSRMSTSRYPSFVPLKPISITVNGERMEHVIAVSFSSDGASIAIRSQVSQGIPVDGPSQYPAAEIESFLIEDLPGKDECQCISCRAGTWDALPDPEENSAEEEGDP